MSKITREEHILHLQKCGVDKETISVICNIHIDDINRIIKTHQQLTPQLSEDVEGFFEFKYDFGVWSGVNKMKKDAELIKQHIKALENKLQEQANEIERLKEYEKLAKVYKRYEERYYNDKRDFDKLDKDDVITLYFVVDMFHNQYKSQLNAIRGVCNSGWNGYNAVDLLNELDKILEEE